MPLKCNLHRYTAASNWATIQSRRMDRFGVRVYDSFFPSPESVTSDYWDYSRYRFFQRIASSCITVFSTQQMLQAVVGLCTSRVQLTLSFESAWFQPLSDPMLCWRGI